MDPGVTLDDIHEAVNKLEEAARIARRAFCDSNPIAMGIENAWEESRAALHARDTPPSDSNKEDGDLSEGDA